MILYPADTSGGLEREPRLTITAEPFSTEWACFSAVTSRKSPAMNHFVLPLEWMPFLSELERGRITRVPRTRPFAMEPGSFIRVLPTYLSDKMFHCNIIAGGGNL